jgi:hypothetical protein
MHVFNPPGHLLLRTHAAAATARRWHAAAGSDLQCLMRSLQLAMEHRLLEILEHKMRDLLLDFGFRFSCWLNCLFNRKQGFVHSGPNKKKTQTPLLQHPRVKHMVDVSWSHVNKSPPVRRTTAPPVHGSSTKNQSQKTVHNFERSFVRTSVFLRVIKLIRILVLGALLFF